MHGVGQCLRTRPHLVRQLAHSRAARKLGHARPRPAPAARPQQSGRRAASRLVLDREAPGGPFEQRFGLRGQAVRRSDTADGVERFGNVAAPFASCGWLGLAAAQGFFGIADRFEEGGLGLTLRSGGEGANVAKVAADRILEQPPHRAPQLLCPGFEDAGDQFAHTRRHEAEYQEDQCQRNDDIDDDRIEHDAPPAPVCAVAQPTRLRAVHAGTVGWTWSHRGPAALPRSWCAANIGPCRRESCNRPETERLRWWPSFPRRRPTGDGSGSMS